MKRVDLLFIVFVITSLSCGTMIYHQMYIEAVIMFLLSFINGSIIDNERLFK